MNDITEFYDPRSNTWSPGPVLEAEALLGSPTIAYLSTGKVLILGEQNTRATLLDPSKPIPQMLSDASSPTNRYDGATNPAVPLPGGKVLFVGSGGTAEVYTPDSGGGSWEEVPSCAPAACHILSVLADGRVLANATANYRNEGPAPSPFVFDPSTKKWTATGTPVTKAARGMGALIAGPTPEFPDRQCAPNCGYVLVAGHGFQEDPEAELYAPSRR